MKNLSREQIRIDCDVIQADGGTRTAAITGGYIALYLALNNLVYKKVLPCIPLYGEVVALFPAGFIKDKLFWTLTIQKTHQPKQIVISC